MHVTRSTGARASSVYLPGRVDEFVRARAQGSMLPAVTIYRQVVTQGMLIAEGDPEWFDHIGGLVGEDVVLSKKTFTLQVDPETAARIDTIAAATPIHPRRRLSVVLRLLIFIGLRDRYPDHYATLMGLERHARHEANNP